MTEYEIKLKLQNCRNDLKRTNSQYRKNDLRKYEKKLLRQLKQIRSGNI